MLLRTAVRRHIRTIMRRKRRQCMRQRSSSTSPSPSRSHCRMQLCQQHRQAWWRSLHHHTHSRQIICRSMGRDKRAGTALQLRLTRQREMEPRQTRLQRSNLNMMAMQWGTHTSTYKAAVQQRCTKMARKGNGKRRRQEAAATWQGSWRRRSGRWHSWPRTRLRWRSRCCWLLSGRSDVMQQCCQRLQETIACMHMTVSTVKTAVFAYLHSALHAAQLPHSGLLGWLYL